MNKKYRILLLAGLLVSAVVVAIGKWKAGEKASPDPKEEFRQLFSKFNSGKLSLHLTGTIRLFDKEQSNRMVEETSFEYIISGSGYYSRLHYLETFFDGRLVLQLDTLNQNLRVTEVGREKQKELEGAVFPFEQFIQDTSQFRIHLEAGEKKESRWLKLVSELHPEIKSCQIFYDPVNYEVKEVEVEWWKEPQLSEAVDENKCWVARINYRYHPPADLNVKEKMDRIIRVSKRGIEPREKYKQYNFYGL